MSDRVSTIALMAAILRGRRINTMQASDAANLYDAVVAECLTRYTTKSTPFPPRFTIDVEDGA